MRRFIQDKGRTSAPQVWEISRKGNAVTSMWGQKGGAMQKTTQTFEGVNIGKANEKKPADVAQDWLERQVLLRTRKGYVEVNTTTDEPLGGAVSESEIDFEKGLPLNLRFFKPQNSLNGHCEKLLRAKTARLLRKRDGMMHVIFIGDGGGMWMYSSTMQSSHKDEPGIPWLQRYPHLAQEISNMHLPAGTVLLGELCTTAFAGFKDKYGMPVDDFEYVSTITKSLTPLALEKQKERGPLGYCIWDIGFWEGSCILREWTADTRFQHLIDVVSSPHRRHVTVPEMVYFSDDNALHVTSLDTMETFIDFETDDLATQIEVFIGDISGADAVAERIEAEVAGVQVTTPAEVKDQLGQFSVVFNLIIVGASVIAVIVGGLSVINTMVMTVSERVREIGIKKAVGARTGAILREFLLEATLLGALGGLIGLSAGSLLVVVLNAQTAASGTTVFLVTPWLLARSFIFATVLGALAGIYPAFRAARLDPVQALRST